jgi:ribosomal protein S18 acetylase RimI-like enzyme
MIDITAIQFREVQPTDGEALTEFFLGNNVQKVTDMFTAFPLNEESARFIAGREHKDKYYLLLFAQQIVGFSMLRGFEEGFVIPSFGIMIDHQHHNMGFGKQLLGFTVQAAKEMGCPKVRLSVYGSNSSGRKIYEGIGFYETDRSPVEHNGIRDEKIIMMKDLQ